MSKQESDFVLNAVRSFITTLWWGPQEYIDALTLILAVTHVKDAFSSVPYALFTSDKPETGKTTASTHIPLLLADSPWEVNSMTTEPAMRAKFMDRVPPSAVLAPDISKIFGESGLHGRTSKVYQLLVAGYLRTGKIEVSVNRVSTRVPAYFVAFLDGLNNAVPADLATRSVKFRLTPKPPQVRLRDALSVPAAKEAEPLQRALHRWAASNRNAMAQFLLDDVARVHPKLTDRKLQLWGPMFAVAHAAGGQWPRRCLTAFLEMALDTSDRPVLLAEQKALLDTALIALEADVAVIFTAELIPALRALADDFYSEVDTRYLVTDLLPRALGPSANLRGTSIDGRDVTGDGRKVAPILRAAADLQEMLDPEPADAGADAVQRAMELKEVK